MNSGSTAWVLVSIALVLLMTPGLAFFYGGLVHRRQVINTIKMSFVALGVIAVEWAVIEIRSPTFQQSVVQVGVSSVTTGALLLAEIWRVIVAVAPFVSVIVRRASKVPPAYVCCGVAPLPVVPSPKFQAYDAIEPAATLEPVPSNWTLRNVGVAVNAAFGAGGSVAMTSAECVPVPPSEPVTVSVTL